MSDYLAKHHEMIRNRATSGETRIEVERSRLELLEALKALLEWGRNHTSPIEDNSPHLLLIAAHRAIEKAENQLNNAQQMADDVVEFIDTKYLQVRRTEMTVDRKRRIVEAIAETQRIIEREMKYMPEHRDSKLVADYELHRVKLVAMLGELQ